MCCSESAVTKKEKSKRLKEGNTHTEKETATKWQVLHSKLVVWVKASSDTYFRIAGKQIKSDWHLLAKGRKKGVAKHREWRKINKRLIGFSIVFPGFSGKSWLVRQKGKKEIIRDEPSFFLLSRNSLSVDCSGGWLSRKKREKEREEWNLDVKDFYRQPQGLFILQTHKNRPLLDPNRNFISRKDKKTIDS